MDFGIARAVQDGGLHARLTHTGNVVGTPAYMSPEHALSPGNVGPCGDVYGLGAVLYEALTGEPPFRGTGPRLLQQVVNDEPRPPGRLNDRVPRDLETICLKCLQKEPARRYASAGALADDLGRFLRDEPVLARPPGWLEWTWRKAKAHKPAVIVGGVILAVILAVAIVGPILAVVYSALAANERTAKVAAEEAELRMGAALAQAEAERERGYTIIQRESIRAARRALRDDLRADARGALLDVPASGRGW